MNLPVGSVDEVGATESSGMGYYASRGIYLFCVLASATGRNVYFVLAAWVATDVSKSTSALAILLALGSAAELLTSNVGGVLVDRFDRRFVCIACDLSRLILIFSTGIGLSFGHPLDVLCLSWTIFAFLDRTYSTALQAIIPDIVRPKNLTSFNSASYIAMQAGNLIAAIVTGYSLTAIGMNLTSILPGAFFGLSLLGLLALGRLPLSRSRSDLQAKSIRRMDLLPMTFVVHSLKTTAVMYALTYAMGMLVSVLGAAYVTRELMGSALEFGYLEAGWALGSIAGCSTLLLRRARSRRQSILFQSALAGIVLLGFPVFQSFLSALVQLVLLGFCYNVTRILIDVRVQSTVSIDMLGRARSQIHTICVSIGLLAYGIIGTIGDAIPPSGIFGLFGALMVTVALFFHFNMDRGAPVERRFV
ncbi:MULTISPECIES: MFS transporter [Rhizobium]|jgi:MFS family permease|uniref:MFS transporter n=1 Tax=Rhizobium sophoriradicis TaxID=1535245 RepID=A0A2A5KKW9_9HYPH|nr:MULTISPECIES: MFS transporter [Rhizobium]ARM91274.1 major facilitator superfamily protein [Rhizobium sp. CIAT894]MBB4300533.1 MFS family permease [Rhizobium leguminosarum]MBB4421177.1 MFS family permease [Rhizobium leguminosarum]MBB4436492.1 MFS family permease [Rhizobium esperanzae]MBB4545640.1 MFS family permease [Rhizobium leguminosarum]